MSRCLVIEIAWLAAACAPALPNLDVLPPAVVSIQPPDGGAVSAAGANVVACLSKPLDASTITPANVLLSRTDGHTAQTIAGAVDGGGSCLVFTPLAPLPAASTFRFELKSGLQSAVGVALSKSSVGFVSTFGTEPAPAAAVLTVPLNGMLAAPLDLRQVLVSFSGPVAMLDGGEPFSLSGDAGSSTLAADGLSASAPPPSPVAGATVGLTLSDLLRDSTGQAPSVSGILAFTYGGCAEGDAPSVSEADAVARDTDAIATFTVDRPSLCAVALGDPDCPDAGALIEPAVCSQPYDPCVGGLLCDCQVPLTGLCPRQSFSLTPQATGYDGLTGAGGATPFTTSGPLPALVVTEVRGGSAATAFVEVQNRGQAPLDLLGTSLVDCGGTVGCSDPGTAQGFGAMAAGGLTVLQPDGYALLVDPGYTGAAPPGTLLLAPQQGAGLMHLSDTKAQELGLLSVQGAVVSIVATPLWPVSGGSLERIDPSAPDSVPNQWAPSTSPGGTPGACNTVTPGSQCDVSS